MSNKNLYMSSEYLRDPLCGKKLRKIAKAISRSVKKSGLEFDSIAFRGMSGALLAPTVASLLEKPLLLVRKGKTSRHSKRSVEGYIGKGCSYIIIDDFIFSGETVKEIQQEINDECDDTECVGIFLYNYSWGNSQDRKSKQKRLSAIAGDIPVFLPINMRTL